MSDVRSPWIKADDVAAALRDQRLAFAYRTGLPLVLAYGAGPDVVFANAAAATLFGAFSLADMRERLFSTLNPGGLQLGEAARSLRPQAAPRLLRLRLPIGRSVEPVTVACRTLEVGEHGATLFAAFVTEVRRGLPRPSPDVRDITMDFPAEGLSDGQAAATARPARATPVPGLIEVKAALQARFPGRRMLRFLWHTNEAEAITSLGPELEDVVGIGAAELLGKPLAEALPGLSTGAGHAVAALARRETWNGVEMMWPLHGTLAAVPVAVSATPIFDPLKIFKGYRGFGVIHLDRLTEVAPRGAPERPDESPLPADPPGEPATSSRNVVPLRPLDAARGGTAARPANDGLQPGADPTLSPGEHYAFREIARALGVRLSGAEAGPAEAAARFEPVPPPRDQQAGETEALLDVLPMGLLVSRGDMPLYLNRTLLDLLSYEDVETFRRVGGLDRIFQGHDDHGDADSWAGPDGGKIPIVTRHGEVLTVDGRLLTIQWRGEPATLMCFRHSADAENAARLRSLEFDLNARDAQIRQLRALLDAVDDAIVVIDPDLQVLALNNVAETIFGYAENEIAGEKLTLLLAPGAEADALAHVQARKALGAEAPRDEGRIVAGRERHGGIAPFRMSIRFVGGGEEIFCAVMRPMSPGVVDPAVPDDTRERERERDFLGRFSHETRTPLNAIAGFAGMMIEERFGPLGNERYKDYLKDIHAAASQMTKLVGGLIHLFRIESGAVPLAFAEIDLNAVVTEAAVRVGDDANTARVVLRMALAARLPAIVADAAALRDIVANLLSNAVKFNEPGGQVIVSTTQDEAGHVVLRMRDTGIGMSEAAIARAMRPFANQGLSDTNTGAGLGLMLARALTEALHGSLTLSSRVGAGTLVEVVFPRVAATLR